MWIAGIVIYCAAAVLLLLAVSIHNELTNRHRLHHR